MAITTTVIKKDGKIITEYKNTITGKVVRRRVQTDNTGKKSMSKQCYKEQCDINNIISKSLRTGVLSVPKDRASKPPEFGVFDSSASFHDAMCKVKHMENEFKLLPARLRAKFDNDPKKAVQYLEGVNTNDYTAAGKNKVDEAFSLGLISKDDIDQYNKDYIIANPPETSGPPPA